jgi:hypothetical protein
MNMPAVTSIRRLDRRTRLMICGAALVVALSACGAERSGVSLATESPTHIPTFVPTASPIATASPTPDRTLEPSPSPSADVLLRVEEFPDVLGPQGTTAFQIDASGMLVRRVDSGWDQLRLSEEGVRRFLDVAARGGLVDEPAEYTTPTAGYGGGFATAAITLMADGGPITVSAINASDAPEANAIFDRTYELIELAADPPADWLVDAGRPAEAWIPPWYTLVVELGPDVLPTYPEPPELPLIVEQGELPLDQPILEIGEPHPESDAQRCAVIAGAEAEALRAALYAAGYERTDFDPVWSMFELEWTEANGIVALFVGAVPPGEAPSCERLGW